MEEQITQKITQLLSDQDSGLGGLTLKIYANLIVRDGGSKPTEEECTDGLAAMQAAWDLENDSYRSKRRAEYPSIGEQLDKIYHSGIDAWKTDIKAIKDKYPKS